MSYGISAPGFLLAVLLSRGVVPAFAQGEMNRNLVAPLEISEIANLETSAAGTADAALVEGQQAYHQGQLPLALERLSQAITQFEAVGNADGVAAAQVAITPVYITMENLDEAATAIQAALSYYQSEGSVAGEAQALVALGELQISEKDYDAALASLQQAVDLSEQTQDSFTQGKALLYVGVIYGTQEDHASALTYIDQALPLLQDNSDTLRQGYYQASALTLQAMSLIGLEEFGTARALIEPIQSINQSLQHPAVEGYLFLIDGTLALPQGDVDAALKNYQRSLDLFQSWSFAREAEVLLHSAIGGIYFEQQNLEQASLSFNQISTILAEQENTEGQLEFLFQIGNLHQENEYYAQAQTYYEAALAYAQVTSRAAEGTVLNRVGYMLYLQEQYGLALEFLLPALEAMKDAGNHADEPAVLGNIINTYQQLGISEKSEEYRLQLITWYQANLTNAENDGDYDTVFAYLLQLSDHYGNQAQSFLVTGREYLKSDPQAAIDSAHHAMDAGEISLDYAQQMLQVAQSQSRDDWMPKVNFHTAIALISTGQAHQLEGQAFQALNQLQDKVNSDERSLEFFERALPFALSSEHEALESLAYRTIIGSQTGLTFAYSSVGEYEKAIEIGLQSLQTSQEINDLEYEISSLSALSNPYIKLAGQYREEGRFEEALESLAQAESLNKEIIAISDNSDTIDVDKSQKESALGSLWSIYLVRQGVYKDQNLYEEALEAAYETLGIAQQLGEGEIGYTSTGLRGVADAYHSLNRYSEALAAYERFRQFAIEKDDFRDQSVALYRMGIVHATQSQYPDAINKFEQAIAIARDNNIVQYQVDALNSLSSVYATQGKYDQAIEELNNALVLIRDARTQLETALTPELLNEVCYLGFTNLTSSNDEETDDFLSSNLALINYEQSLDAQRLENTREGCIESTWYTESSILHGIGGVYTSQGRYLDALDFYNQSLEIDREIRAGEVSFAITYEEIGDVYRLQGNYDKALELYNKALDIYVRRNSRYRQATTLNGIGIVLDNQGQHAKALEYFQQALTLAEELNRRSLQSSIRFNMASFSSIRGDFQESLVTYYEALEVDRELGHRAGEVTVLNSIASTYYAQGQLDFAEQTYTEALAIAQEIGSRNLEIGLISGLGDVAEVKGDYATALDHYQQALEIAEEIDSQVRVSQTLFNMGLIYLRLGQYATALNFYERSLEIDIANGNIDGQATTLTSIAGVYYRQQQYDQTIDHNQQALAIHQETANLLGQVRALDGIGLAHERQGNYDQALATYQEALELVSDMDARFLQSSVLSGLGLTYAGLGDTEQAMDYLEQALAINRAIGNPAGEARALSDMGKVLAQSNQLELAIALYKQSVNIREGIREGLEGLDRSLQQSYVDTVADTYRELADLLLQQNRILEAQRVLDLLKVQELDEALRGVRSTSDTSGGVAFWQMETDLLALYNQVIADADELAQLEDIGIDNLDPTQQQRLQDLRQRSADVQRRFTAFLDLPEVRQLLTQIRQETEGQNLAIETQHRALQNNLRALPQKTALLYPLILPDRLELVLVTADGPPLRYPIAVDGAELNRAIVAFGQALKDPRSDIQPLAQQLYGWLVAPLEDALAQAGIESLLYAPDGALRYVPLAALHDGDQYLAQRFSLSQITAVSLSNLNQVPDPDQRRLLAAACAECSFTVTVGDRDFAFEDLPYTEPEVKALAEQMPNTRVLLNQGFSRQELENRLGSYSIIHLATHGAVVENDPRQSFIVFGSEEHVTLENIRQSWNLSRAELVVLSACETAVGSTELGSGVEILGLGYQIQQAGAMGVLASLWKVSDQGTQVLMGAFYDALGQGMTKAEALQAAQNALITNDFSAVGGARATGEFIEIATGQPLQVSDSGDSLAHPYFWAPFILIGNGL